jgi:hypothetical protein
LAFPPISYETWGTWDLLGALETRDEAASVSEFDVVTVNKFPSVGHCILIRVAFKLMYPNVMPVLAYDVSAVKHVASGLLTKRRNREFPFSKHACDKLP